MATMPLPIPPPPEGYVLNPPSATSATPTASAPLVGPGAAAAAPADIPPPPPGYVLNQPAAPGAGTMSTVEDVAKTAPSSILRGIGNVVGAPGDVLDLANAGLNKLNDYIGPKLGYTPEEIERTKVKTGGAAGGGASNSADVTKALDKIGMIHEPQTPIAKGVEAVGEMVPTALLAPGSAAANLARYAVAPGIASEAAGQATKGTALEPWARAVTALAVPALGVRAPMAEVEHAANVALLRREGVTGLTAGQEAGSSGLTGLETLAAGQPLSGRSAEGMNKLVQKQFTNAALKRVGEAGPANAPRLATDDVIKGAFDRIGNDFDGLAARNRMEGDRQLGNDLHDAARHYEELVPPTERAPIVNNIIRDVGDAVANNGGSLPGEAYQALRSRLGAAARSSNDPHLSHALSDLTEGLDDAMRRSIQANNPADLGGFEKARREYRNMLVVERAKTVAGKDAADGVISPAALRSATKAVMGRRAVASGEGDFSALANAGQSVLAPLENKSGLPDWLHHYALTALLAGGGAATGGGIEGLLGHVAGGAAGFVAPSIAARGLLNPVTQGILKQTARQPTLRGTPAGNAVILRGLLNADHDREDHP
jgi:hypothetical protein